MKRIEKRLGLAALNAGAVLAILSVPSLVPTAATANEIGYKCGYISAPAATYTYKNVRVRAYPDAVDCTRVFGRKNAALVLAKGFSGDLSDLEVRAQVAKMANAQK